VGIDVVALDDFLYSEPTAVPEPSTLMLLGTGAIGMGTVLWRRRRLRVVSGAGVEPATSAF
jgi:PEP-CTERM motif